MFPMVKTMKNLTKIENNKIEANVDCFIIPNSPARFLEGFQYEDAAPGYINLRDENVEKIANMNGVTLEKGERLVQVWLTSEHDLGSINLGDHGFKALNKDGEIVNLHFRCNVLPAVLLNGKIENDVFDLNIKCFDREKNEYDLLMHVRCCQSEYRYRRFGTFESVFKSIIM